MTKPFLDHLKDNLRTRRAETIKTLSGLIGAIVVAWIIIGSVLGSGTLGVIIAVPGVILAAKRMNNLSWFWTASETSRQPPSAHPAETAAVSFSTPHQSQRASESDEDLEHVPIPGPETILHGQSSSSQAPSAPRCEPVRKTPVGTRLVRQSPDEAVLTVKSAIHFWCWAAPAMLGVATFIAIPVGGWVGFTNYREGLEYIQMFNPQGAFDATLNTAVIMSAVCFVAAIVSYFMTRPNVRVVITPRTIQYGDKRFDRLYSEGVRAGFTSKEVDLPASFTQGKFGVTNIRLTYGRWGEDLKYMINAHHANEIVIWMNEIIDGVGAPPSPRYEAYQGRKIELL